MLNELLWTLALALSAHLLDQRDALPLYVRLTLLEGVVGALEFFRLCIVASLRYDTQATLSSIVRRASQIFPHTFVDRHTCYACAQLLYLLACLCVWRGELALARTLLCALAHPSVLSRALGFGLSRVLALRNALLARIFSKIGASLLRIFSTKLLRNPIVLHSQELRASFADIDPVALSAHLAQLLLATALMMHAKAHSSKLSYWLLRKAYLYKTAQLGDGFSARVARQRLMTIFDSRDWKSLIKPENFRALIHHLQYIDERETQHYVKTFEFLFLRFCAFWTVGELLGSAYLPLLALFPMLHERMRDYWRNPLVALLCYALKCTSISSLPLTFISAYGSQLLFSTAFAWLFFQIFNKLYKLSKYIFREHWREPLLYAALTLSVDLEASRAFLLASILSVVARDPLLLVVAMIYAHTRSHAQLLCLCALASSCSALYAYATRSPVRVESRSTMFERLRVIEDYSGPLSQPQR